MDRTKNDPLPLKWMFLPWFGILFTVAVFVVLGFIAQGDPSDLLAGLGISDAVAGFGLMVIGTALAVGILGRLLSRNGLTWADVGIKGKLTGKSILYALLGWIVSFLLFYGVQVVIEAIGMTMFWGDTPNFISVDSPINILLILLGPVLIASVAEEIIFRGYILNALLPKLNLAATVVLAALIFASVHVFFGAGFLIYIFIGSFIPIYLYLTFDSLYPAMLMHFLNNLASYVFIPLLFLT